MKWSLTAGVVVCLPLLAGCASEVGEGTEGAEATASQALIQDAVHNGGRPGFYFLPPLVERPALVGTFDGTRALTMTVSVRGGATIATIPMVAGTGQYAGTWSMKGLPADETTVYRLTVSSIGHELGFLDAKLFAKRKRAKILESDELIELVDGHKLQVKAFINKCADVDCSADSCHGPSTCDPDTGACAPGPTLPGCGCTAASCDDGDACTADACGAAGCTHTSVACDDGDSCTADTCDPVAGCSHAHVACDDGDLCTADACDPLVGCSHAAVACDDGNACSVDACDPTSGCTHALVGCDDGDICTTDGCDPATGCVNTPASCDDGNTCTTDSCDSVGGCSHASVACDDGDACHAGACVPGIGCVFPGISCDDQDPCTLDACDPATGCSHTYDSNACNTCSSSPDGATCTDNDACTSDDYCSGGVCAGTPLACDDNDACTIDSCSAGACQQVPVDCDDGDPGTADGCDPSAGCTHTAISPTIRVYPDHGPAGTLVSVAGSNFTSSACDCSIDAACGSVFLILNRAFMNYTPDGDPSHGLCCVSSEIDCTGAFITLPNVIIPLDVAPGLYEIIGDDMMGSNTGFAAFVVDP